MWYARDFLHNNQLLEQQLRRLLWFDSVSWIKKNFHDAKLAIIFHIAKLNMKI